MKPGAIQFGQSLFHGSQTNLSYVPEQQTDFIFTAVGEHLGFAGSVLVVGLFAVLAWRAHQAAELARDRFGALICAGVLGMLVIQIVENIGMTAGILPVAGIPFPC